MPKSRLNLKLDTQLYRQLGDAASERGAPRTAVIEQALREHFDPTARLGVEERLLARMDQFDLGQSAMERDLALCLETLGHFIFYWLTRTEPIPEGERDAAHALGQRRFDYFIEQVGAKLGTGKPISQWHSKTNRSD